MKRYYLVIILASALALQSCATTYDADLKQAQMLAGAGDNRAAYSKLDGLCKQKPDGQACIERTGVKSKIGAAVFDKVNASMTSDRVDGLLPLPVIASNQKDVDELATFGFAPPETATLSEALANDKVKTDAGVSELMLRANTLAETKDRVGAISALRTVAKLDPEKKASVDGTIVKLTDSIVLDARAAAERDDWKTASALYAELKYAAAEYPDIETTLADAQSKDNLDYYINAADEAAKKEDFSKSLRLYKMALNYPDSDSARLLISKTLAAAAQSSFKKGQLYYDSSQPYRAYQAFVKGQSYLKDIPFKDRSIVALPTKAINDFLEGLSKIAEKEDDKGNYGLAYQLMKMVNDIDQNFSNAKKRLNALQEKITQRAIKGVAVIPFKSPSYTPEAGKIFSSNITFFLYKNLTPDIKVVEREAMETLLKEYEVKTAGQMDDRSRENILSLLGADYLLFGDVLDYKVESNQSDTIKSVRAQTRTEQVRNPQYDDWLKDKDRGVASLPPQPPVYVDKPVIEEIKYKVSFYKKTGLVSMSYRVVDTKGRLLNASVVEIKEDVEDDATDGVDAGDYKVATKRATVPSDIELLRRVQEKAIQKIGDELKKLLLNPEQKYLTEAERFEKDGELRDAIERYSDVEIIYLKKGMDSKEVTDKIGKLLDTITGI